MINKGCGTRDGAVFELSNPTINFVTLNDCGNHSE